VNNRLLLWK